MPVGAAAAGTLRPEVERKAVKVESHAAAVALIATKEAAKAVAHKLFTDEAKKEVVKIFQLRKGGVVPTQEEIKRDMHHLLAIEAQRIPSIGFKDAYEMSKKLLVVRGLFDEELLYQKPTDPVFKLSKVDTTYFNVLPEELKKEILSGRRIKLEQTHKLEVKPAAASTPAPQAAARRGESGDWIIPID
jgi:hypothetical protein